MIKLEKQRLVDMKKREQISSDVVHGRTFDTVKNINREIIAKLDENLLYVLKRTIYMELYKELWEHLTLNENY